MRGTAWLVLSSNYSHSIPTSVESICTIFPRKCTQVLEALDRHIHQVSHWCHSTRRNPPDVQYTLQHLHTLSPRWIMWLQSMRKSTVFWAPFTDRHGEREREEGVSIRRRVLRDCQRLKRAFWLGSDWGVSLCLASSWVIRLKRSLVLTGDRSSCT